VEEVRDKIISVNIEEEMQNSYIDYAMSVIASRALPDVRDGLKPVHRRILYSMAEQGFTSDKKHRKSARIVGDVIGKYHPHGDSSIYDAMVRMAQDFNMRYPLVDGQGNFGNVDGDSAAAMRYTEARMSKLAGEMVADIKKNTVDFGPNFDETEKEPKVLPARYPNLLVNGTSGIAVGMATNIPPHNLNEVVDGVVKIIDNKVNEDRDTEIDELLEIITGPDLPTGATIMGKSGIEEAYRTGRGKFKIRSVSEIEPMKNGKQRIIITEIPYQVNKSNMIIKIADLVKDKKVEGITDIRDESNRLGTRVVIELKRDINANVILNQLYKYTQLQESFGIIMLALVDGEPKVLNLKQMLDHYLAHQVEVITRRTQFDLDKAEARAHILEGLRIALDNIDEIIKIIRGSKDTEIAKNALVENFGLTLIQAEAIIEMKLRRLTGLERDKIEQEYRELMEIIKELKAILADRKLLYGVIKEEILVVKEKFGNERKTEITFDADEIDIEDLIKEEQCVITMTHLSYIKRMPLNTYKSQNRGGKGIKGMQTREEDVVEKIFICSTHDNLLFFTNLGRVYKLKGYEVPSSSRTARGNAIINILNLEPNEEITTVIPVKDMKEDKCIIMATEMGQIKKTHLNEYENIRKSGIIALGLNDGDSLIEVDLVDDSTDIILATEKGQGIRFDAGQVREMGRTAKGVRGIKLNGDDRVKGMVIVEEDKKLLVVTEKGLGKKTDASDFNPQNRGGKGVKIHKLTTKTGDLVGIKMVTDEEEVIMITSEGIIIRLRINEISKTSRVTQGVKLINLESGVKVVGVEKIVDQEAEEELEDQE
jgi:DNA gyrase subunit A